MIPHRRHPLGLRAHRDGRRRDIFTELREEPSARGRVVSADEVARRNPHIILASWCGKPVDSAAIATRPGWQEVDAVKGGRIYEVAGEDILSPGPRCSPGCGAFTRSCRNTRTDDAERSRLFPLQDRHPPQAKFCLECARRWRRAVRAAAPSSRLREVLPGMCASGERPRECPSARGARRLHAQASRRQDPHLQEQRGKRAQAGDGAVCRRQGSMELLAERDPEDAPQAARSGSRSHDGRSSPL